MLVVEVNSEDANVVFLFPANGVLDRVDERFALDIERRIQQHWTPSPGVPLLKDFTEDRCLSANRLDPRGVIKVGDRWVFLR